MTTAIVRLEIVRLAKDDGITPPAGGPGAPTLCRAPPRQARLSAGCYRSSCTGFRSMPMPLMSTSQMAPSAISEVVPGVPVKMQSPGSSVT